MKVNKSDIIKMYYIHSHYADFDSNDYWHCSTLEELQEVVNDAVKEYYELTSPTNEEYPYYLNFDVGDDIELDDSGERNSVCVGYFVKLEFDDRDPIYVKV